jgi:hypothetical protein
MVEIVANPVCKFL